MCAVGAGLLSVLEKECGVKAEFDMVEGGCLLRVYDSETGEQLYRGNLTEEPEEADIEALTPRAERLFPLLRKYYE